MPGCINDCFEILLKDILKLKCAIYSRVVNGATPSWGAEMDNLQAGRVKWEGLTEYRVSTNKRAYMASPQAPPTPISKLSDMTRDKEMAHST
ncbi:hypothetical protein OUZ56_008707 [Daphnia magna]|uniref:Uncharacterized protein n=1 Tax=Daphnia magna TaxID=35525 RepID=A0ABR0AE19_9CRUS|nr:hypothetical protein OUZ56_008707 [Daphnia magna]